MRLIDADKLDFSKMNLNKSQMKAVLDFVDAQPTAFDIDAVLEELEENTQDIYRQCTDEEIEEDGIEMVNDSVINAFTAKYIVKTGGANE